jgi:hypothetical protein
MHTKQAPEFDLESQIHYSSYLFLPESEHRIISPDLRIANTKREVGWSMKFIEYGSKACICQKAYFSFLATFT